MLRVYFVVFVHGAENHFKNLKKLHSAYIMQHHNIKPWEHHFSKKVEIWPALPDMAKYLPSTDLLTHASGQIKGRFYLSKLG